MNWIVRIRWTGQGTKPEAFETMAAHVAGKPLTLTVPTMPEFEGWCFNWFGVRWLKR